MNVKLINIFNLYVLPNLKNFFNKIKFNNDLTIDHDVEKTNQLAKKALNDISNKLTIYIRIIKENQNTLHSDFISCADLFILNNYIEKRFTGTAMRHILNIIEIDILHSVIKNNQKLLNKLKKINKTQDYDFELMTNIVDKQKTLRSCFKESEQYIRKSFFKQH